MTIISLNIPNTGTRDDLRRLLVEEFLKEPAGAPGQISNYTYHVETLSSGDKIYLTRPTNLNWGFDFKIHVENQRFPHPRRRKGTAFTVFNDAPSHDNMLDDLSAKKSYSLTDYALLYGILQSVYNIQLVSLVQFPQLATLPGYSIEMVVGVFKWLFIEQDITYWNLTGRYRLMDAVPVP